MVSNTHYFKPCPQCQLFSDCYFFKIQEADFSPPEKSQIKLEEPFTSEVISSIG